MSLLGTGLTAAARHEDALSVKEAELSMRRRIGAPEGAVLAVLANLAVTYKQVGRLDEAERMRKVIHSRRLKLNGEEHEETLRAANNYATSLVQLQRFDEAKSVLRKAVPVARRVLGESDQLALKMRMGYARALYKDKGATLDDLREAVTTFEDTERTARRVLGGANPTTVRIEESLRDARAALRARDGGVSAIRDAVEAMAA